MHISLAAMLFSKTASPFRRIPVSYTHLDVYKRQVNGHTWQAASCYGTTFAAKGMLRSGEVLAMTAYDLLTTRKEVLTQARQEWEKDKEGKHYIPIPSDLKPYLSEA